MAFDRLLRLAIRGRGLLLVGLILGSGVAVTACLTRTVGGLNVYCDDENPCTDPFYSSCQGHLCAAGGDGGMPSRCGSSMPCLNPAAPICDDSGYCRKCSGAADNTRCGVATSGLRPLCDVDTQLCVACLKNSDCADRKSPVCDKGLCRPCTAPADCPSGVCAAGSCADEVDVAFVDNSANGCPSGAMSTGSRAAPFCEIATAIPNLKGRNVVSVKGTGTAYVDPLILSTVDIVIVGPGRLASPTAVLRVGSGADCIQVNPGGGSLVIDGLDIGTCGKNGLVCNGPGSVSLLRSSVHGTAGFGVLTTDCDVTLDEDWIANNASGGVRLNNGHYKVTNSFVVSHNIKQAAVVLGEMATGTFSFNTVADNNATPVSGGINCGFQANKSIENSIVVGNSQDVASSSQLLGNCVLTMVVTGADKFKGAVTQSPIFDMSNPFHLDRASTCCVDVVRPPEGGPALLPNHDGDGNHRPFGAGWDVGAHEVQMR